MRYYVAIGMRTVQPRRSLYEYDSEDLGASQEFPKSQLDLQLDDEDSEEDDPERNRLVCTLSLLLWLRFWLHHTKGISNLNVGDWFHRNH